MVVLNANKKGFLQPFNYKAVKLYAISHKINYREKRSSPWPLVQNNSHFMTKIWVLLPSTMCIIAFFDGKMGSQRTYFSIIYVEALVYFGQFSYMTTRFQLAKRQISTILVSEGS